jgi:hypothetical protein
VIPFAKFARSWLRVGIVLILIEVSAVSAPLHTGMAAAITADFPFTYNTTVAQMIAEVQQDAVYSYTAALTGEVPVTVGGESATLHTRNMDFPEDIGNATQYVYEFMGAQGLSVSFQEWYDAYEDMEGRNVVGVLTGTVRPDEIVLVTAHLDDMPEAAVAPGADDNASGAAGVMMAAARLAGHSFERTVRFVFLTGEEYGLLGSYAYAQACADANEDVVAVYNMDMIAWDDNDDGAVYLETRRTNDAGYASDLAIATVFNQVVTAYGLDSTLTPHVDPCGDPYVDSWSFWEFDYPSITAIEDFDYEEMNPYYHTVDDTIDTLNFPFFTANIKATVGTVAHLALPGAAAQPTATKSVLPAWLISPGAQLTYAVAVSGAPGTQVGVYDPLTQTTFVRFTVQPAGVIYANQAITGVMSIPSTGHTSIAFVTQVKEPASPGVYPDMTNTACLYPPGQTLSQCRWSNTVVNRVFNPTVIIFLPVVIRNCR